MAEFAHLHLHTAYSLLDGAIRLKDLFPRVKELGMSSVAITDHGNMYGALDFYRQAKAAGVKPIFGCETYVAGDDRKDRSVRRNHHLVLLARNEEGFANLRYLSSMGFLEGFYYVPRVDKPLLRERAKGLFALSACLGGEVAQALLTGGYDRARQAALEYRDIFEPGAFHLEIQPNGLEDQLQVNAAWLRLSRETGIPLVATGDCHYIKREDARAQEILMCIQQGRTVDDPSHLRHETDHLYVKSPSEMEEHFKDAPEALENAARIAAQCNVEFELDKFRLPTYPLPEGHDADSFIRRVAADGLERRFREFAALGKKFDPDEYRARLETELAVITKMGFSGYFLIVQDFINHAKDKGIPVGPGRGSGAGSLVAYSLRITDIDPLPYKLLFERFLNPERVSMPDFDIDFCMNRREEVIQYVTEKYGRDRVGQIVTMHQLKARGVIRDIARALGVPVSEADMVAKLVPEPQEGKPPTIDEALKKEPKLQELYDGNDTYRRLIDLARSLEGLNRHAGMHAAGVVIAEKPLWEEVPVCRGPNGELESQYAKEDVEHAGLVKFDFLGLKNLTVIDIAIRLIRVEQPDFDLNAIPLDDPAVYKLISEGDTTGVFQMESPSFRSLLQRLRPDRFEDIIAVGALHRPGPMKGGMVDDFVARKHGTQRVTYPHPSLKPILEPTYGVVVYQEQVMQIARALAGYSLGGADLLRRAMGKKKAEVMAKERAKFLAGAEKNDVPTAVAQEIFGLMEKFAEYGFNKSHSAAYGLITYQTGYLKAHFPEEFMCALLTCDKDDTDKVVKNVAEVRSKGVEVLRPDVNQSSHDFSVVKIRDGKKLRKVIRFGLAAVKGVGQGAVEAIIEARGKEPIASFWDFCERVDARRCNKKVIEALIKSGALDELAGSRAQKLAAIDMAVERAVQTQRDRETGQTSLFGLVAALPASKPLPEPGFPSVDDWTPKQKLALERESLGFYISGHPVDRFRDDLRRFHALTVEEALRRGDRSEVSVGGVIADYRERPMKTGTGRWATFQLEDESGQMEVLCFSKVFEQVEPVLKLNEPLLVTGTINIRRDLEEEAQAPKIQMREAVPLAKLRMERTRHVTLLLSADMVDRRLLEGLRETLARFPGQVTSVLRLAIPMRSRTDVILPGRFAVTPSDEALVALERLLGPGNVLLG